MPKSIFPFLTFKNMSTPSQVQGQWFMQQFMKQIQTNQFFALKWNHCNGWKLKSIPLSTGPLQIRACKMMWFVVQVEWSWIIAGGCRTVNHCECVDLLPYSPPKICWFLLKKLELQIGVKTCQWQLFAGTYMIFTLCFDSLCSLRNPFQSQILS